MSEKEISLTPSQLQDIIKSAVTSAIKANSAMNPLEQKKFDEQMEIERRKTQAAIELARIDEESRWRKQNSCSHSCHDKTGESVARGTGRWTTSGQMHGDGTCTLICVRCATAWHYQPTRDESEYILNGPGLLGYAPPPLERCLNKNDFATRPAPRTAVSQ